MDNPLDSMGDKGGIKTKNVQVARDPEEVKKAFLDQYYRLFGGQTPTTGSPVAGMQQNLAGFYGKPFQQVAQDTASNNAFYSRPRFYAQKKQKYYDEGDMLSKLSGMGGGMMPGLF